jgi:hypothetical protein
MTDDKKEPEEEVRVDLLEWYKPFEKVLYDLNDQKIRAYENYRKLFII